MVFRRLILQTSGLNNLHFFKANLNSFDGLSVNPCRKNKALLFPIVPAGIYAMMQFIPFLNKFSHRFQRHNLNALSLKFKVKKRAFAFHIVGLIFQHSLSPFFFLLLFSNLTYFLRKSIMFLFKILRAYVFRIM